MKSLDLLHCKLNRSQLEIIANAAFGLHPKKYFGILNLLYGGKSLVTRHVGLHSNSRGTDEVNRFQ